MKAVIAIDSFKGSLTSIEAGNAVKQAYLDVLGGKAVVYPVADGGEGAGQGGCPADGAAHRSEAEGRTTPSAA